MDKIIISLNLNSIPSRLPDEIGETDVILDSIGKELISISEQKESLFTLFIDFSKNELKVDGISDNFIFLPFCNLNATIVSENWR